MINYCFSWKSDSTDPLTVIWKLDHIVRPLHSPTNKYLLLFADTEHQAFVFLITHINVLAADMKLVFSFIISCNLGSVSPCTEFESYIVNISHCTLQILSYAISLHQLFCIQMNNIKSSLKNSLVLSPIYSISLEGRGGVSQSQLTGWEAVHTLDGWAYLRADMDPNFIWIREYKR